MFVYAINISGLPQDDDAFDIMSAEFGTTKTEFETAISNRNRIIVADPSRDGEMFFDKAMKSLGQVFTALSRSGLFFTVYRKRYDGNFKAVADFTVSLKVGRKAWREERLRVEAAGESLESFLCKEANSEDMEVLRPLFPNEIGDFLQDEDTGVLKGSEVMQTVFPTLKGGDCRRIFHEMQLLNEKRAAKWKSRFGCAWVSAYFIMAVLITYGIYEWLTGSFDWHGLLAAPTALVLSIVPIVGSSLASIAAVKLWDWPIWLALLVFFWYYIPAVYLVGQLLAASFRGEGKTAWNKLIGKKTDDPDEEED